MTSPHLSSHTACPLRPSFNRLGTSRVPCPSLTREPVRSTRSRSPKKGPSKPPISRRYGMSSVHLFFSLNYDRVQFCDMGFVQFSLYWFGFVDFFLSFFWFCCVVKRFLLLRIFEICNFSLWFCQITTGGNDKGLKLYDPGYLNTAPVRSSICYIDGDEGILRYRGYPIEELAESSTYLEVAYCLSKYSYGVLVWISYLFKDCSVENIFNYKISWEECQGKTWYFGG